LFLMYRFALKIERPWK